MELNDFNLQVFGLSDLFSDGWRRLNQHLLEALIDNDRAFMNYGGMTVADVIRQRADVSMVGYSDNDALRRSCVDEDAKNWLRQAVHGAGYDWSNIAYNVVLLQFDHCAENGQTIGYRMVREARRELGGVQFDTLIREVVDGLSAGQTLCYQDSDGRKVEFGKTADVG